ncbi:hypothetical protein PUN28_013562 [Cardiocondyla obscurior]|uniref:Ribosomal protein S14 n=1 Tax=Cardiocondyla obscurior TaxID=286306 RepID=A0AAW2F658_9HYME
MVDRCGRRCGAETRVCRSMPSCFEVRRVEFQSRDTPLTRRLVPSPEMETARKRERRRTKSNYFGYLTRKSLRRFDLKSRERDTRLAPADRSIV